MKDVGFFRTKSRRGRLGGIIFYNKRLLRDYSFEHVEWVAGYAHGIIIRTLASNGSVLPDPIGSVNNIYLSAKDSSKRAEQIRALSASMILAGLGKSSRLDILLGDFNFSAGPEDHWTRDGDGHLSVGFPAGCSSGHEARLFRELLMKPLRLAEVWQGRPTVHGTNGKFLSRNDRAYISIPSAGIPTFNININLLSRPAGLSDHCPLLLSVLPKPTRKLPRTPLWLAYMDGFSDSVSFKYGTIAAHMANVWDRYHLLLLAIWETCTQFRDNILLPPP